jgi:hypothetical protein
MAGAQDGGGGGASAAAAAGAAPLTPPRPFSRGGLWARSAAETATRDARPAEAAARLRRALFSLME